VDAPPEIAPEPLVPSYPDPAPEPWRPPEPEVSPEPIYGAGDFDAALEARGDSLGDRLLPTVCYLLMIGGTVSLGLTAFVGAWLAYRGKRGASQWVRTHYLFQIRTFWIGLAIGLVGAVTFLFFDQGAAGVVAGALWGFILIFGVLWYVLRMAAGLSRLRHGEAFRNYRTWLV
jgi:uncharacterized membrane protein